VDLWLIVRDTTERRRERVSPSADFSVQLECGGASQVLRAAGCPSESAPAASGVNTWGRHDACPRSHEGKVPAPLSAVPDKETLGNPSAPSPKPNLRRASRSGILPLASPAAASPIGVRPQQCTPVPRFDGCRPSGAAALYGVSPFGNPQAGLVRRYISGRKRLAPYLCFSDGTDAGLGSGGFRGKEALAVLARGATGVPDELAIEI
jgi:hypothetical protein